MKKFRARLQASWVWLQTDTGLLVATMVCLPLGLVLVIRSHRFTAGFKKVFGGLGAVVCLVGLSLAIGHHGLRTSLQHVSAQNEQNQARYARANKAYRDTKADYDQLDRANDAYHAKMKPYENLAAAEAKKRQADAKAAQSVTNALEALPATYTLSVDDKAKVQAVRKSFDLLSKAQQALVDETTLKADEAKIGELEKAAAAKAAEAKKKAEEEARGYDTGITYDQLARTPDTYEGKKVKFYGEVAQVMESDGTIQARLAVNGDYDNMLLCEWSANTVSSRVLEDDMITVSGVSTGLITYESTMGGDITIPSMSVAKIDR